MIDQLRTKMISAQLVRVDAGLIQAAHDFLTLSKNATVVFQVVNGYCVDIDTEQPQKLLRIAAEPKPGAMALSELTMEKVLEKVQEGHNTSMKISDAFGFARDDTPLRGKVSRMLYKLKADHAIALTNGKYTVRTRRPVKPVAPKISRDDFSSDTVVTVLQEHGPQPSIKIGDILGIARTDTSLRSKITAVVREMLTAERIQVSGRDHGMKIYELKEAESSDTK